MASPGRPFVLCYASFFSAFGSGSGGARPVDYYGAAGGRQGHLGREGFISSSPGRTEVCTTRQRSRLVPLEIVMVCKAYHHPQIIRESCVIPR